MKESNVPKFARKTDFIILGIIAAACIICLYFMKTQTEKGNFAQISVNGKILANVSLKNDEVFCVSGIDNVEFEVKGGAIRISSNDCNDKVCQKTGFVSNAGESIVCIPKKLTVTVKSASGADFDAATG